MLGGRTRRLERLNLIRGVGGGWLGGGWLERLNLSRGVGGARPQPGCWGGRLERLDPDPISPALLFSILVAPIAACLHGPADKTVRRHPELTASQCSLPRVRDRSAGVTTNLSLANKWADR